MSIRLIATVVIAALLTTGTVATIPRNAEYGTATQPTVTTTPEVATLTAEQAEEIALTHAGLTREVAKKLGAKLEKDDPIPHWEVEFYADGWEYDYSIHAQTGVILKWEKEQEKKQEAPQPTKPVLPEPKPETPSLLTEQEAVEIALNHGGFAKDGVTDLRAKLEKDDRLMQWDVEFRAEDWEYDYTIHAETGAILDFDREYEPKKPAATKPTEPAPEENNPVTGEQAVEIALSHAGLTRQQVRDLDRELEKEGKSRVWEVEFEADGWEYEYQIDYLTGKILRSEKERDD